LFAISTPGSIFASCIGKFRLNIHLTIDLEAARIQPDMLYQADEAFVTNSQIGLRPARACAKLRSRRGHVTRRLMAGLEHAGISECRL
jgi:branched-subunit amino acid aminotransferase/4-amino-4-deoxychorismate lyase